MPLLLSRVSITVCGTVLGIAVLGYVFLYMQQRRMKRNRKKDEDNKLHEDIKDVQPDACTSDSKKRKRLSPNYFIAVPVTNCKIHEKIKEIQESIRKKNRLFQHLFVPLPTLHVTIMVLHIENDEQLNQAKTALDACRSDISNSGIGCPVMTVRGVGNFNDNVLFAAIAQDTELERLNSIAHAVIKVFSDQGLSMERNKEPEFTPHITIMKFSKAPWLKKKGIKKIDPRLYADYSDIFMGHEPAIRLQLCSMNKPKDASGYYHVDHEISLSSG